MPTWTQLTLKLSTEGLELRLRFRPPRKARPTEPPPVLTTGETVSDNVVVPFRRAS